MSTKLPSMSWDTVIKLAVYALLAVSMYSNMRSVQIQQGEVLIEIKKSQKEDSGKWDLRLNTMQTEIQTLQIEIGEIKQKERDDASSTRNN